MARVLCKTNDLRPITSYNNLHLDQSCFSREIYLRFFKAFHTRDSWLLWSKKYYGIDDEANFIFMCPWCISKILSFYKEYSNLNDMISEIPQSFLNNYFFDILIVHYFVYTKNHHDIPIQYWSQPYYWLFYRSQYHN